MTILEYYGEKMLQEMYCNGDGDANYVIQEIEKYKK